MTTAAQIAPLRAAPQAVEVEKHIIGAMLLDAGAICAVFDILKPSDFYSPVHQQIAAAIQECVNRREQVDLITVTEAMKRLGTFVPATEFSFGSNDTDTILMGIMSEVVSYANVEQHAQIVLDKATLRSAIALSTRILQIAYQGAEVAEVVTEMDKAAQSVRAHAQIAQGIRIMTPAEWVPPALAAYDQKAYRGESTGWTAFDQIYRVAKRQINTWTGMPGHGKSEVIDHLMLNLACGPAAWRVGYWSPENNPHELHIQKLAEKLTGKPLHGIGRMTPVEYRAAVAVIEKQFTFFDPDAAGSTFAQVLQYAERISPALDALVIDPWNMLEQDRGARMTETEYVLACLRMARYWVKRTNVSLHIVAHPAKLEEDFKTGVIRMPNLYSISGSAHWFNATFNGFIVFRNHETGRVEVHALKVKFKNNGRPGKQEFTYDVPSGRYTTYGNPTIYGAAAPAKPTQKRGSATSAEGFAP